MISTLVDIAKGSRIPYRSDKLTVSRVTGSCFNYSFVGFDCNLQSVGNFFAEIVWNPVEYLDEIESDTNLLGEQIKYYHKKTGTMSFTAIVDEELLGVMNEMSLSQVMSFSDVPFTESWAIYDFILTAQTDADVIVATVSFKVVDADSIISACCGSLYEDPPFEPCDPDGPAPPVPTECIGFTVGITAALPVLTATSSGGPGGTAFYQWFFDANNDGNFETLVSETAQSLNLVNAGTYRVQVSQGGCSGTSDFLYSDPCIAYAITLTFEGGLLIAEPNFDAPAYAWYQPGDILDPGDTDNVYVPTSSGIHTVRVTTPACGVIVQTLNVNIASDCVALTYDLTRVDNELQILNLTGCNGVTTYSWLVDIGDGNGFGVIAGATGPTLQITQTGLYRSSVICDNPNCNILQDLLVLDNCVLFKAWISIIAPTPGGVTFTAASSNAPPGSVVNYTWYEWISENWQLLGTGMTLFISDTADPANVRLIATAGQCTREDFTHDCVDPNMIEPYQAFAVTIPMTTEFTVTAFTFEQPYDQGGTLTENQIGAKYIIERNGLIQKHRPLVDMATTNEQNVYSYDWADNKLVFPTNNPMFIGDRVSVANLQV